MILDGQDGGLETQVGVPSYYHPRCVLLQTQCIHIYISIFLFIENERQNVLRFFAIIFHRECTGLGSWTDSLPTVEVNCGVIYELQKINHTVGEIHQPHHIFSRKKQCEIVLLLHDI